MEYFNTRNELLSILDKKIKICEIGVFKGEFSKILIDNLDTIEIHLIDIFEGEMCSGDKDGNNIIFTNLNDEYVNLKKIYENNKNVIIHKGTSYEILNQFKNEYFDMIYIDGDHTYDGVKKDLKITYDKVKCSGFICGHDYVSPRFDGVVRAVNEFCEEHNLTIDYLTNDGCPTYCIKKTK